MHSFPKRNAFVFDIVDAAKNVQDHYTSIGEDPGYNGYFEKEFCKKFSDFMGGGMCDAVSSGTTALYVAIRALHLPPKSRVLVSAVTDPGTINAIIMNDLIPQLVDSDQHSYNVSVKNIIEGMKSKPSAVVVVHASGLPVNMLPIMESAKERGIKVVEDCSQAHGAEISNGKVGTFGDISAFSMMNRKNIAVNGTAGMVYSRNEELFKQALAIADRGKPVWLNEYPDNDPRGNLFPSLNFNLDEISCSLGIIAMTKIDEVIRKRRIVAGRIQDAVNSKSKYFYVNYPAKKASPFVIPVYVRKDVRNEIDVSKYAENLRLTGVPLNPHYRYLVSSWPYVSSFISTNSRFENAALTINESFVLYLNENYKTDDIEYITEKIVELERSIEMFQKSHIKNNAGGD